MADNEFRKWDVEDWFAHLALEVTFESPDDFLKIKETLSRMGIASNKDKKLYQSCHILHKRGKYYITHFKELFAIDGKSVNITEEDIARRNLIASLLQDWGLLSVVDAEWLKNKAAINTVKIIKHSDKDSWEFVTKYTIGGK